MSDLAALLERVKGAAGPDEELVRDLCQAFMHRDDYPTIATLIVAALSDKLEAIGASLALVEKLLPGCSLIAAFPCSVWAQHMPCAGQPIHAAALVEEYDGEPIDNLDHESGATPPLAILAALLSALIAKEST